MAYFAKPSSGRRFTINDPEHQYHRQIVGIYDAGRSYISVAPIGDDGMFCDNPIPCFQDQLEDLYGVPYPMHRNRH